MAVLVDNIIPKKNLYLPYNYVRQLSTPKEQRDPYELEERKEMKEEE